MIKVDCTLVRATHRDLKRLSADRGFREDLFYRITGLGVALPALRERRALFAPIQHLLCAETIAHQPLLLSTAALEALMAYHWRGNFDDTPK